MQYKDYIGVIDYDEDDEVFHGRVINTRDVITFQGRSIRELRTALKDSVDDYLALCEERGEAPDRPFSGKFNVRLSPELHRSVALAAVREGKSLNAYISAVLERRVAR